MRKARRVLATILAMVMLACASCLGAYAANEKVTYDWYLHFGDSTSTGYLMEYEGHPEKANALDTSTTTQNKRIKGSYPDLVASSVGIKRGSDHFYKFAREGVTSNDERLIVQPGYWNQMASNYQRNSNRAFDLFCDPGTLKGLQTGYKNLVKNRIKKSDKVLVTMGIGSNDIIISPLFDVVGVIEDAIAGNNLLTGPYNAFAHQLDAYLAAFNLAGAWNLVITFADVAMCLPQVLAQVAISEINAYTLFYDNFDNMIAQLKKDIPQADIVVLEFYNATANLKFTDISLYNIGANMGVFTALMNAYVANQSPQRANYEIAQTRNVPTPQWPSMITWLTYGTSFMNYFMYCSHPMTEGHQWIANKIMNVVMNEF